MSTCAKLRNTEKVAAVNTTMGIYIKYRLMQQSSHGFSSRHKRLKCKAASKPDYLAVFIQLFAPTFRVAMMRGDGGLCKMDLQILAGFQKLLT